MGVGAHVSLGRVAGIRPDVQNITIATERWKLCSFAQSRHDESLYDNAFFGKPIDDNGRTRKGS
jgi:hypothetical protein